MKPPAAPKGSLHFIYQNARRELREHQLTEWAESGRYIRCRRDDGTPLSYRVDRIIQYVGGCERHLRDPFQVPPPRIEPRKPLDQRPQVLFTGFAKALRDELEAAADAAGLNVVKSVTQRLTFLCGGSNAGPSKLEKARAQGVYILDEKQLRLLLETGELPDSDDQ